MRAARSGNEGSAERRPPGRCIGREWIGGDDTFAGSANPHEILPVIGKRRALIVIRRRGDAYHIVQSGGIDEYVLSLVPRGSYTDEAAQGGVVDGVL